MLDFVDKDKAYVWFDVWGRGERAWTKLTAAERKRVRVLKHRKKIPESPDSHKCSVLPSSLDCWSTLCRA